MDKLALWTEGFIEAAEQAGVTDPQQVSELLKVACNLNLAAKPGYVEGYNEVMQKQAQGDFGKAVSEEVGHGGPGLFGLQGGAMNEGGQPLPEEMLPAAYYNRASRLGWAGRLGKMLVHPLAYLQGSLTEPALRRQMQELANNPAYYKQRIALMRGQHGLMGDTERGWRGAGGMPTGGGMFGSYGGGYGGSPWNSWYPGM